MQSGGGEVQGEDQVPFLYTGTCIRVWGESLQLPPAPAMRFSLLFIIFEK